MPSRSQIIGALVRTQAGLERAFRRRYAALLERYVEAAAKAYAEQGDRGVAPALHGQRIELQRLLTTNYLTAGERFRKVTQAQLPAAKAETAFEMEMLAYVDKYVAQRAALIADTTEELVTEAIRTGVEEGETVAAISTRIRQTAGGAMSRMRADTIAITETHGAATYASDKTAEETGLTLQREWVATESRRTRTTHLEADGQRRGMNEPFIVGGHQLMRPGDPAGPAEEVIRCRCVVLYHEA